MDPAYWQSRLAAMRSVNRGLIVCPRPDLSTALVDIVEWRIRAHDGLRLWGLHAQSNFHEQPRGARVRFIGCSEVPEIDLAQIPDGVLDLVFPIPPGRKLEHRVLDILRVWQVVAAHSEVDPAKIELLAPAQEGRDGDDFMIATELIASGLA